MLLLGLSMVVAVAASSAQSDVPDAVPEAVVEANTEAAPAVPIPVRYEMVLAPEGFIPIGEVVAGDNGRVVACVQYSADDADRPDRQHDISALWAVDEGELDFLEVDRSQHPNLHVVRAQPTADEHLVVLQNGSRLEVWRGWADERFTLDQPNDMGATAWKVHTSVPDGRVIGQVGPAATSQRYACVWDTEGQLTLIEKTGYEYLFAVDASGEYVIGDAWPVAHENLAHFAFVWHPDEDTAVLPLPEGSSNATGVAVDAAGRVLLSARFYEDEEMGAEQWHDRPFLWTAEDGLMPLPYPEGYSARALGMNEMGQVLMECFDPDEPILEGETVRRPRHFCIVTTDGQGPIRLPHPFEDASQELTHQALGDSGAIGIESAWLELGGGTGVTQRRGAVLVPVYE